MASSTAARNVAADAVAGNITALSLHTADPDGSSGTTLEITGGSYTRETPTYSAAASGIADLSASVVFDGPGSSSTVTHIGKWAGATWYGSVALAESKTFGTGDTLTVSSAPVDANPV